MAECECGCGQATKVPVYTDTAKRWQAGVPLRFVKGHNLRSRRSGERAARWTGGRHRDPRGYVVLWQPGGRRQYEHIVIAELSLGRSLKKGEVVHHINGDKTDNRNSNLLICTAAYHAALHIRLEQSEAWPEFQRRVGFMGYRNG